MRKNMMSKPKKNKYPHRISCMGYANLAAELAKEMGEDKLTRRLMWKKARQYRNGNYRDPDTANKAVEIDKLDKEEKDGSYCGPDDALTKALGNPEHRRRAMIDEAVAKEREYWVAKLGFNISPPAAPSPASPSPVTANSNCGSYTILPDNVVGVEENDEEVTVRAKKRLKLSDLNVEDVGVTGMQLEAEHVVEEDAPEMNEAPTQQPPPPPVKEKAVSNAFVEQLKQSECRLALGSVDYIVAIGKLVGLQDNNIDNEKIHGVPMAEWNVRVTILRALVPDAKLPFLVKDELITVQDAVNIFVAWPKVMIVRSPPAATNNKKPASKKYPEGRKTKKGKAAGSEPELRINLKKLPKDYPGPLRCLWIWVTENLEDGKTLELKVTAPVFGIERSQRLYKSDMYAMCTMGLVSSGILIMYMCYLHEVLKKAKMLDMVAFVDPYQIATQGCWDAETRARTLSARFATAKKGQLFIMPKHWILTVVKPEEELVYFFDPVRRRLPAFGEEWTSVVDSAIKIYKSTRDKTQRKILSWLPMLGVPEQFGSTYCGFFIMRYMKDIVEDKNLDFASKWKYMATPPHAYTPKHIDEVRVEWVQFLMKYHIK